MTKKNLKRLAKKSKNKNGIVQSKLAREFKCTQQYISKCLKKQLSLKCYKKEKIPERTK